MSIQLLWVVHTLPLWFLVFSLFLPRVALLVYWMQTGMLPFHVYGWVTLAVAVLLPRALILYLIYLDQGLSLWFLIHLIMALVVWTGSENFRRRRKY